MELTYIQDVSLASADGGRIRKQILPRNKTFRWPNKPGHMLSITDDVLDQLIENFKKGVVDVVPFFKVNEKNSHTEDPEAARGRIVDLIKTDEGLDAIIEPLDDTVRSKVLATRLGASAGINLDYTLHDTGEKVGAVLRHVAWTPEPWIPGMKPFEEVSLSGESYEAVFLTTDADDTPTEGGENDMTPEEIRAMVEEQVKAQTAALSTQLDEAKTQLETANTTIATLTEAVNKKATAISEESVKTELSALVEAGLPPAIADLAAPILMAGDTEVNLSADETGTIATQMRAILQLVPKVDFSEKGEAGLPEGAVVVLSAEQVKTLGFTVEKNEDEDADLSADDKLIADVMEFVPAEKRKEA